MYIRESIVLESNFQNGDFDEFTHLEVPMNPNSIFLAVCLHACKAPNLVFYTCIICRYGLKYFIKIEQVMCVQGYTKFLFL